MVAQQSPVGCFEMQACCVVATTTTNSKPPNYGGIKKYQILMFKKLKKLNTFSERVKKMAIFGYEFYLTAI